MKILYIISTLKGGNGGHAYSLSHICTEVSKYAETKIISIGPAYSKVVTKHSAYYKYLYFCGKDFFKFRKDFRDVLAEVKPDIIHCFDANAYNIIKLCVRKKDCNLVLNKCGGPNKSTYPITENLVLFSKENEAFFKKIPKYNNTNIKVIANRVSQIKVSDSITTGVAKEENVFSLVRISRIGKYYKSSLLQAINLIALLKERGLTNVRLYIIGIIEDNAVIKELQKAAEGLDIRFLTEDKYAITASKMLYLADAVIATGRGLMEATSIGLPVLTPASNSDFPVLVTERNFSDFFYTNFSERNVAPNHNHETGLEDIELLIKDNDYCSKIKEHSLMVFNKHFNIVEGGKHYMELYKHASESKRRVSVTSDIKIKLLSMYGFYKSAQKLTKTV